MTKAASTPDPAVTSRPQRNSGVFVPHAPRWYQHLAAAVVCAAVRGIDATIRYRLHDEGNNLEQLRRERLIFAIWHNRLALSLMLYRRLVAGTDPLRTLAAMVSASRDGGMLTSILELFGVQPVRGSSSRRGPQALREMVSWGEAGYDLAITPDGPRGPVYEAQEGAISTAQLTGLVILPVSYYLRWKWRAKSWDRFQVPLPFTRCDVLIGKPIRVPRDATDIEREALRQELQRNLREISRD